MCKSITHALQQQQEMLDLKLKKDSEVDTGRVYWIWCYRRQDVELGFLSWDRRLCPKESCFQLLIVPHVPERM